MAAVQCGARFDRIAEKWHALARRRLAHLRELEHSGRWKKFYTQEQFDACRREAERIAAVWARLAAARVTGGHAISTALRMSSPAPALRRS